MAFKEIEKTRKGYMKGAPATFAVNKKGVGSLRFNRAGMNYISGNNIGLKIGDMIRLYYDAETGKVAIKKSKDGQFRLSKNSVKLDTMRISSSDLTGLIQKPGDYEMEKSQAYDLVLIPKK
jgi:bifunctional DNA-binding transcriptional regulator/antitoxin component of YhaV-PrlF toxin-antitoxin module